MVSRLLKAAFLLGFSPVAAAAQVPSAQNTFADVVVDGGLTGQRWKFPQTGYIILDDSAATFHFCYDVDCPKVHKQFYKDSAGIVIPYRSITQIDGAIERHGPSVTSKFLFGGLAAERRNEMVSIAFDDSTGAQAPVFETREHDSARFLAQLRWHLRKLGILPTGAPPVSDSGAANNGFKP